MNTADTSTPDLTDYRVVHRAMVVDSDRLATAAAELVQRPDPARLRALRRYRLAAALREIADLLVRHIADEERDIFPIIVEHLPRAEYLRLQQKFRGNLDLRQLPFVACWVIRHATADERTVLLGEPGPLRLLVRLFEPRFRARERVLFGPFPHGGR